MNNNDYLYKDSMKHKKRGTVSTSSAWGPEKAYTRRCGYRPRLRMEAIMFSCLYMKFLRFQAARRA